MQLNNVLKNALLFLANDELGGKLIDTLPIRQG